MGDGGAGGDDVGAQPVDLEGGAHLGYLQQRALPQADAPDPFAGRRYPRRQRGIGRPVALGERAGVGVVGDPPPDHLRAQARVPRGGDLHGQPEPVEELRAQLALLRVHRADEHEPGGVLDGDAVPFDGGAAHRGGVQQQVDEVVVEQVDLVDVEDAPVGAGQQAGLVLHLAVRQRALQVQRAEDAVLGGADRQFDEPDGPRLGGGVHRERAVRRGGPRVVRIGGETVPRHDVDGRQHGGERAHRGRLGGALLAPDQHAADLGGDGGEDQRQPHVAESAGVFGVTAEDCGKGVLRRHVRLPLASPSSGRARGRSSDLPGPCSS